MNKRIYFLMVIAFVVGMVELIISGILDLLSADLNVSISQAGYLITIFALIFAFLSPVLLIVTANIERKRLMLICLWIFLIGNIVTIFSPNYTVVFIGRVISAMSGALLTILCLVMAPNMVQPEFRGRAIGIISMGVSGSLVLGVPIGLVLGGMYGWRAPFVMVAILTILSIIGVYLWMNPIEPEKQVPIQTQLMSLKSRKVLFALLTTFLYMAGHTVLYAYFKPFLHDTMGLEGTWVSVIYFIFGIAAVSGGGIGGTLADVFGSKKTIIISLILFTGTFLVIPSTTSFVPIFIVMSILWGILSWGISPAMQSYLIETSPKTASIQQSLNNSALHLGVASGSFVGGLVIEHLSINQNAYVGSLLIFLSLVTILISFRIKQADISGIKIEQS
ncbi:MFS transporter [Bacillus andreraoultii]|uniref:MFS transporter n=1 Tax=Bacillus andreraoultii TaxID=1499685 RepID=UPI000539F85B|nr:MFS transporter [Bacillus andreraoultii]